MKYKKRTNKFRFDAARSMALRPERIDTLLQQDALVNPLPPISAGALEAKQFIEKAKQLKGNTMPDITTALRTALENSKRQALNDTLNAWEKDEKETQLEKPVQAGKTNLFEVTNNVTRATFNYVRDNPGCTMAEIKEAMSAFNSGSVGSLLTQFVLQNQITRDAAGKHTTISNEYKPLMARSKWERLNGISPTASRRARRKEKLKDAMVQVKQNLIEKGLPVELAKGSGIGALPVTQKPAKEKKQEITSILISRNWTAQGVVDKLTVMQARQLYDLLKNIFGG